MTIKMNSVDVYIKIVSECRVVKKLFLLSLLFLSPTILLFAQDDRAKGIVSIAAGLNNNESWEVEPSVTYYFSKYIGGTLGLNVTSQYNQVGFSGTIAGNNRIYWSIEDDEANVAKFLLHPAISLRTPVLWLDKDHETGLTIQIEPGIYIALPVNDQITVNYRDKERSSTIIGSKSISNTKGECIFWNIRGSISLNLDRFVLSTGYTISNFDIYSGRRNIVVENLKLEQKLPVREYTYSFFVSLGYCF
ncbi:hypothetical protein EAJ08_05100 [Bacteroides salyersiae]|nr:hypothetical protein EAJ08_05100 [Bacteroides salyersiae]